jgi:hypothetical protein
VGELRESSDGAAAVCDVDPAVTQALITAERAAQASRVQSAAALVETTPQPAATSLATPASTPAPPAGTAASGASPTSPAPAAAAAPAEASRDDLQPDPRSVFLPLICGLGIFFGALAFAFVARRRERGA